MTKTRDMKQFTQSTRVHRNAWISQKEAHLIISNSGICLIPPFENFLLLCYDDHVPHAEMWKFMKFGSDISLNKKESNGLSKVPSATFYFVNWSLRAYANSIMDNSENWSLRKCKPSKMANYKNESLQAWVTLGAGHLRNQSLRKWVTLEIRNVQNRPLRKFVHSK